MNNNSFDETRSFSAPVNGEMRIRPTGDGTGIQRNAAAGEGQNIQRRAMPGDARLQSGNRPMQSQNGAVQRPNAAGTAGTSPVKRTAPSPQQRQTGAQNPNGANSVPRPIQRPNPQNRTGTAQASSSGNNSSPRRVQPASQVNPQSAQLRTPANHGPSSEGAQSTKAISSDVRRQMMKTRTTGISDIREKDKPRTEERSSGSGSGEGGNTIISVLKAVVYIVFVCVVSVFLAVSIIFVGNDIFAFVKSDAVVEIVIPENTTLDDLAELLHDNGVIEYPSVFKLYAVAKNDNQKYVAGTYSVTPMMNYSSLLAEFKEKIDYGTVRITIPEGYTTDEIIDLFVANGIGTREGFIDVIENGEFDYWFIDELEENGVSEDRIYRLDGYLFPDTYDFYKSSSEKTVINKLLRRFGQMFLSDYRDQCEKMGYTVDEIITLASIIEKEAANLSEFFKVSSVFHNRLNNPWNFPKLESDATVVYAIQHETGERNVDLNYETPYNTYMYEGFTPGPIANPSASAILAALTPNETNYYFFYSYEGVTYFSETKEQHEAYIEQFRNQAASQTPANIPEN